MEDNKNNVEVNESIEEMKQEIHQEEIKELLKDFKEEEKVEEKVEDVNEKKSKKGGFLSKLVASILDETLIVAVSFAFLYLFDAIIKLAGLFVAQKQPVFFIIVVVLNIIYAPIMESTKVKTTVGKALLKI